MTTIAGSSLTKQMLLIFVGMLLLCALVHLQTTLIDPDLFARLAVGRLMVETGSVPFADPFAFTQTKGMWIDHEWLSGLVFYLLWSIGGTSLLVLTKLAAWGASLFLVLYAHTRVSPRERLSSGLMVLVAFQSSHVWLSTVRSQLFTYVFIAYFIYVWSQEECRTSKKLLFSLPVVMVFWANAHGGFVVGLGLFAVHLIGNVLDRRTLSRSEILSFLLCCLAAMVNPYGPITYWSYILQAVTMKRPEVDEWSAVSLLSGFAIVPNILLLVWLVGLSRRGIRGSYSRVLPLSVSLLAGYSSYRLMAIPCLLFPVFGKEEWCAGVEFFESKIPEFTRAVKNAFRIVFVFSALSGFIALFILAQRGLDYRPYPVNVIEWLKHTGYSGKLLCDFNAGSFALWKLYPQFTVSMDGRYEEVYPNETVKLVARAFQQSDIREREAAIKTIDPDFFLLHKSQLPTKSLLEGAELLREAEGYLLYQLK